MSEPFKVPPINAALIRCLNEIFPVRCADPKDTEREIWMKAGERRMVDWLAAQVALQENPD